MSPAQPVARWRMLAILCAFVGLFAGVVGVGESLRHPLPDGAGVDPASPSDLGDPRQQVVCPEPQPREDAPSTPETATRHPPADLVSSDDLYDCPAWFDNQVVRYRGEVVGGILRRADGAWVQLNDDVYAGDLGPLPAHWDLRGGNSGIGVLIPLELADEIEVVGGPRSQGDVLEVIGTFHRVSASSEVAVVHADSGQIWRDGHPFGPAPLRDRQIAAVLAALLAAALLSLQVLRSRRP